MLILVRWCLTIEFQQKWILEEPSLNMLMHEWIDEMMWHLSFRARKTRARTKRVSMTLLVMILVAVQYLQHSEPTWPMISILLHCCTVIVNKWTGEETLLPSVLHKHREYHRYCYQWQHKFIQHQKYDELVALNDKCCNWIRCNIPVTPQRGGVTQQ